jgi:ferredoxin-NADP reductase
MAIHGASNASEVTEAQPGLEPAVRWQNAVITEIIARTPKIKSYFFRLSEPFIWAAGQHVDVRLTAPSGYRAMRSYSIAGARDRYEIELAIELLQDGEVSTFFHEIAAVGDTIELRGPLGGHFVWSETEGGPLLLAGGGSGVVPLMAMVRRREAAARTVPIALLCSARSWDDVLYREELIELAERHNGLSLVLTLTRERPRRPGDFNRRVDASMMIAVLSQLPAPPKYVFVCGSNHFVNAAADGAVASGIPARIIRTERYGGA